jgi:hypothetical protein
MPEVLEDAEGNAKSAAKHETNQQGIDDIKCNDGKMKLDIVG